MGEYAKKLESTRTLTASVLTLALRDAFVMVRLAKFMSIYVNLSVNVILGYNLCQVILTNIIQDLFSEEHSVLSWTSIGLAKLHFPLAKTKYT